MPQKQYKQKQYKAIMQKSNQLSVDTRIYEDTMAE